MNEPTNDLPPRFPDFEAFTSEGKTETPYNNFATFFFDKPKGFLQSYYRDTAHAKAFREKHPRLDKALKKRVTTKLFESGTSTTDSNWSQEVEPLLFVAYRMMEANIEIRQLLQKDPNFLTK